MRRIEEFKQPRLKHAAWSIVPSAGREGVKVLRFNPRDTPYRSEETNLTRGVESTSIAVPLTEG